MSKFLFTMQWCTWKRKNSGEFYVKLTSNQNILKMIIMRRNDNTRYGVHQPIKWWIYLRVLLTPTVHGMVITGKEMRISSSYWLSQQQNNFGQWPGSQHVEGVMQLEPWHRIHSLVLFDNFIASLERSMIFSNFMGLSIESTSPSPAI